MKNENIAGKQITQTQYVHVRDRDPGTPFLMSCDMSDMSGYICIGPVEITYTVPAVDVIEKAVEAIDSQVQKLRAEFQSTLNSLEEKKQQLLAIGYDNPADDFVSDTIYDKE